MRYVGMTLRQTLAEKFPDAADEEILKVPYYRLVHGRGVVAAEFRRLCLRVIKAAYDESRNACAECNEVV